MDIKSFLSTLLGAFFNLFRFRKNPSEYRQGDRFKKKQAEEGAFDARDRGVQTVSLEQITGSVGRYQDFDHQFRFRDGARPERFVSVLEAMKAGKVLPPVTLYQIKDEYYVVDGNHRVAAAKELQHDEILAKILEFIPSRETLENRAYREKMQFCDDTGLPRSIKLTELGQYEILLDQIREHHTYLKDHNDNTIAFEEAAKDWYKTIFLPFCAIIRRGGLSQQFPGRTLGDLYTYISYGYWGKEKSPTYGIGLKGLIPQDMEAFRSKMAKLKEFQYPEMKRGITAFILMNTKGKQEMRILEKLYELDEVVEIHSVHGDVDFLLKVVLSRDLISSDAEIISDFVHKKIRLLNGVNSTKTLIPGFSRIKPPHVPDSEQGT